MPSKAEAVAAEVFATLGSGRQIASFTGRASGLTLDEAYAATALVERARCARGEHAVGRKIGFTNRSIWTEYGIGAPIWGYVTDRTRSNLGSNATLSLAGLSEPKIEPEIVLGLAAAPKPGMDDATLLDCVAWIAHGFEIVQSIYPHWKFGLEDTVAANAMHGALLIGPRHAVAPRRAEWLRELVSFEIELFRDGASIDRGRGTSVLEGPLSALRYLVGLLANDPHNPPLAAGEIVSTGTLTRAFPITPGERWTTQLSGIPIEEISLRFE